MNKAQQRCCKQAEHGRKLMALFGLSSDTNPLDLYNQLHRIEARAHTYAERVCNGEIDPTEAHDASILRSVRRVLGNTDIPIIINSDPHGYALTIPNTWMREHQARLYSDWSGFGIICPDF
jgi:hypothetical protein